MKTPHQDFQKAKEELIDLLKNHEAVLAFQEAEKAIADLAIVGRKPILPAKLKIIPYRRHVS